ncbi:MAG: DUF2079 domain-containing protein [bacterium]|nr:DUF2079 domain-containing protein [bacterium]
MVKKYGVWLLIFLFGSIYSLFSVLRHLRLESFLFDLGYYDQIVWLSSNFKTLFSSISDMPVWADHFNPTLLLLTPLYWLWDNVIVLLIFQAFFAALGAYPIFRIAQRRTKDLGLSLLASFLYLGFFGLQNAIAFDFHPIVLATTLLAFLFWFYEEKSFKAFGLTFVLFVGLQENFFLLGSALGLFLIFQYRDIQRGLTIFVGSLLVYVFIIRLVIPFFGQASYLYLPSHLNNLSFPEIIKMLFYPFIKVKLVAVSLLAFGFFPIFSPSVLVLLLEEFGQRFLGTSIPSRWDLGYHYNIILAPALALGVVFTLKEYFLKRKALAYIFLITGFILTQIITVPGTSRLLDKNFFDLSHVKDSKAVLSLIPKDASVAATNNLGAQLTHRQKIIFLTNCQEDSTVWYQDMKRCYGLKPDYLVADLNPDSNPNNFYPDNSRESIERYFTFVQQKGEYQLLRKQGDVYLLKRK